MVPAGCRIMRQCLLRPRRDRVLPTRSPHPPLQGIQLSAEAASRNNSSSPGCRHHRRSWLSASPCLAALSCLFVRASQSTSPGLIIFTACLYTACTMNRARYGMGWLEKGTW